VEAVIEIHNQAKANKILIRLPQGSQRRVFPLLRSFELPLGAVLFEPGQKLEGVYFPVTSLISQVYLMRDGQSTELSLVGSEGLVGIGSFLGGGSMPFRSVVQGAGTAFRLPVDAILNEFEREPGTRKVLLRYTQALITNIAQSAACNRHHSIEQQLSRWLLISIDRLPANEVTMTQELIANMLGVRREGVTKAAGRLQLAGVIRYKRGHIEILDRPGLEAFACECYEVVKREMERLDSFSD